MKEHIPDSQEFYDDVLLQPVPTFPGFETPLSAFRNGVIHIQCDDANHNLKWSLQKNG